MSGLFKLGIVALVALVLVGCATTGGRGMWKHPVETGIASYYGRQFHGRRTASGERYDQGELTAAHRGLPFGTKVRVTNLANDRRVVVRVNDRGPRTRGRILDLSRRAARELGFVRNGTANVRIEVVGVAPGAKLGTSLH